jgi:hypothetical protein
MQSRLPCLFVRLASVLLAELSRGSFRLWLVARIQENPRLLEPQGLRESESDVSGGSTYGSVGTRFCHDLRSTRDC